MIVFVTYYYFKTLAITNLSPFLPFLSSILFPGSQCFTQQIDFEKLSPYKRRGVLLLNINDLEK
jgi:hypothetical protein